jgi:hypothetical protein
MEDQVKWIFGFFLFRPYGALGYEESVFPQGVALRYDIMPLRGGIKTANDNFHNSYIIRSPEVFMQREFGIPRWRPEWQHSWGQQGEKRRFAQGREAEKKRLCLVLK